MSGASVYNMRDRSRTSVGKTGKSREKFRSPPRYGDAELGQAWAWFTEEFLSSPAFTSLSPNAMRAFFRIVVEYLRQGRSKNGDLIVTHPDFCTYGVSQNYVADAIDELSYKGLVKVARGKSGDGTAHANRFRLTYLGDDEGGPWTNDWRRCSQEQADQWSENRDRFKGKRRKKVEGKRKTSLTFPRVSHSPIGESSPSANRENAAKPVEVPTHGSVSTINISPEEGRRHA